VFVVPRQCVLNTFLPPILSCQISCSRQQVTDIEDAAVEPITLQTPPPTQVNQKPTVATGSPTPVVTAHAQE
jgi:hypothetical protein